MPTTYENTQEGGISVSRDKVDQGDAFASQVGRRQDPSQRNLVFQDGGDFGKHSEIAVGNGTLYSVNEAGSELTLISFDQNFRPEKLGSWTSDDYTDFQAIEISGRKVLLGCKNSSGDNGFVVLDVKSPSSVSVMDEFFDSGWSEVQSITTEIYYNGASIEIDAYVGTASEYKSLNLNADPITVESTGGNSFISERNASYAIKNDLVRSKDVIIIAADAGGQSAFGKVIDISDPNAIAELSGDKPAAGSAAATDVALLPEDNGTKFVAVNRAGEFLIAVDDGTAQEVIDVNVDINTPANSLFDVHTQDGYIVCVGDKVIVYDDKAAYDSVPTDVTDLDFKVSDGALIHGATVAAGDELAVLI